MSGPKTTSYTVTRNELLARRAIAAAWAAIREMEPRINAIVADINAAKSKYLGENINVEMRVPSQPPDASSLSVLESHLATLRAVAHQAKSSLNTAIGEIKTRRMVAALGQTLAVTAESAKEVLSRAAAERAKLSADAVAREAAAEKKARAATVTKLMSRLNGEVDAADRRALEAFCEEIIQAGSIQRSQILQGELRFKVQGLNDRAEAQRLEANEASALIAQLRGLDLEELQAIVAELKRVEQRQSRMTDDLRAQVDRLYRAAKATADREYAASVTAEVLKEMGYEVAGTFSTLFVQGGVAHFHKPDWDDYWVRLRVDPARAQINFNVVRAENDDSHATRESDQRDKEMETEWCSQFQKIIETLHHRGVGTNILRREAPGAIPVQVIRDEKLTTKQRRNRPAAARTISRDRPGR